MNQGISNYHHAVLNNFSFLKNTQDLNELYIKAIPIPDKGYLLPLCQLHLKDKLLIEKLAKWRQDNFEAFPSQFEVTYSGTEKWLANNVLAVEDRMLFLVVDNYGHQIGHLGLANGINEQGSIDIDNVVRGEDASPGIMNSAMKTLIAWTEEFIVPQHILLSVFSDNEHAINFYKNLDFNEDSLISLEKHIEGTGIYYRPIENKNKEADKFFLRMRYLPNEKWDESIFISTAGPSISSREVYYASDAARNGWNSSWNGYINRFEKSFADYLGVKHALSTSSCTGALHIALAALQIGPGDEVIVPDITWVATANAVLYVGATPIFADVNLQDWCMDPQSVKSLITERTKAIIPVHLYGHPSPIDALVKIARENNLYVIEDAAPSIGAEWKGQKVGTFGDFAAFSFQGAKLAVCGEGGMLVTNNDELYAKAYALWDQGREPNTFWIKQNGLKYKISNVQAAIGLGQLERIRELIAAKRRIFDWYHHYLQDLPNISLNTEPLDGYSIYWMTSILLDEKSKISRDDLRLELKNKNIDTRCVFPAISQYPHWPKQQLPQPNALRIGNQAINLPSGVCLKQKQVAYICQTIMEILS